MMSPKILVIGSLNLDLTIRVPYLPKIGETVKGDYVLQLPGGKGANQAYAAAKLGGNVKMLGMIGDDEHGKLLNENLQTVGVDTRHIGVTSSAATGMAIINVSDQGHNQIVIVPGANSLCDVRYIEAHRDVIADANLILLQMEIPEETIYRSIELANENGRFIILDPAPAPETLPEEVWQNIDLLTPNEIELQRLTNMPVDSLKDVEKASEILLRRGVKRVAVTLGARGALFIDRRQTIHKKAPEVEVVDTTAAGDCFAAAMAVGLSEGWDEERALSFAVKAASLTVTKEGAQSSIPCRSEVLQWGAES